MTRKQNQRHNPVSLAPLTFEAAFDALLKTPPKKKDSSRHTSTCRRVAKKTKKKG